MLNELFHRRFRELDLSFDVSEPTRDYGYDQIYVGQKWRKWASSAQSLISKVCGERSDHYRNFSTLFGNCKGAVHTVNAMFAIFQSAKDDYEGGYIFNADLRVSGEVFGDFVALSKNALSDGSKDVAAVLACAALEDALKRFATANGLEVSEQTMEAVIGALKSAGLVSGAQKTILESMPKLRNAAMHAQWTKISEPEVASVIAFVEQFVLSNFTS